MTPRPASAIIGPRLIAWLIDAALVALLLAVLHGVLALFGVLTFGLGFALLAVLPAVPFLYSWLSLASRHAATPGQRLMRLRVIHAGDGRNPTPLEAFVSTAIFYLSLTFPIVLLAPLFSRRRRTLHDLLSGLLMQRQDRLTVSQGHWNMQPGPTA